MGATHLTAQDPRGNEKLGVNAAGPPRRGEDGVPARAAADTGTFTTIPGQRRRAPCHEPCACGRALADPAGPGGLSRARRAARGGGKCEHRRERERGIDGREGDQGKCHGPEGFLQPIGFGSPFAGWSRRPVHSTAPGKTKQKHLLILSVALRPPGCASPRSIDSGARLLHASAPPRPRGALGGQPSPRLRSRNSECANRPGRRPRPAARIIAST